MEEGEPGHHDEQNLNGQVLYEVSGGGPRAHGRFAIGNGAVRAADVRAAAKEGSVRPPSHYLAQEVAHLRRENARLQQDNRDKDSALQQNKVTTELTLATGSSHVGSESTNGGIDADGHHGSKDQDGANRAAVVTSHQHSPNHAST
ncbi:hypothetical protein U9M48_043730 [Paspalum notatum var. saurae]|uniref:Uncharacterized protein n=1 Tax=Paspalum notatum var. saurae TaxID=547442 RepID=A0AAQ3UU21_PASNO